MKTSPWINIIISVVIGVIVGMSTLYATFATKKEVRVMVNDKHKSVMFILQGMSGTLKEIDKKLWELQKEKK